MFSLQQRTDRGKRLGVAAFTALLSVCLSSKSVTAQDTPAQGAAPAVESYPTAWFAPFSPQTALDMVGRLPGFSFDPGNEGVRGYGEAGGNVLIDGKRSATKTGGLTAALAGIPAKAVARIEIFRGGGVAGDQSGQSLVANIVRAEAPRTLSGNLGLSRMDDGLYGSASLTVIRTLGDFHLASTTAYEATGEQSRGRRDLFDTTGMQTRHDGLTFRTNYPEWSQRLTLSGPMASGRMTMNLMLARARLDEAFTFHTDDLTDGFPKHTDRLRGEAGFDWTRGLGNDYSLKLLGMARSTDLNLISLSQAGETGDALSTIDRYESRSTSGERILRAAVIRGGNGVWRPEAGVEMAWNTLDSRSLFSGHAASRVFVSEARMEAFGTLNWQAAPKWTVVAGAAYEVSRIKAEVDAATSNRFAFVKPHLVITWTPDTRSTLRLSARRSVGQLSFGDFAASADLAQGTVSAGNTDLGPDSRTTLAFDYDRRFGTRGAFNLNAYSDWRQNVLEAAVLPSGGISVVNVKSARVRSLSAGLELPVDRWIRGGLLKLRRAWLDTEVIDPLTGVRRAITATHPDEFAASFRQDLPWVRLSWGIDYIGGYQARLWYADETRLQDHAAELRLFLETSRFFQARLRVEVNGLSGLRNTYYRDLYTPNRTGAWNGSEVWEIRTPVSLAVSLSRTF
ncbi:TonB-dependent receptor plug domain-containing protein [Asticcacaulis sp.]|uniref:TonB-dependent receptor plug domain-containing protein n=1 Tax=Asticcacaulis sp. TaxID=1872648 RepID=UPI003F7B5C15